MQNGTHPCAQHPWLWTGGLFTCCLCPIAFRLGAILLQFKNDTDSFHPKKKKEKEKEKERKNDTGTATSKY